MISNGTTKAQQNCTVLCSHFFCCFVIYKQVSEYTRLWNLYSMMNEWVSSHFIYFDTATLLLNHASWLAKRSVVTSRSKDRHWTVQHYNLVWLHIDMRSWGLRNSLSHSCTTVRHFVVSPACTPACVRIVYRFVWPFA